MLVQDTSKRQHKRRYLTVICRRPNIINFSS